MVFKGNETNRCRLFHDQTVFVIFKIIGSYTFETVGTGTRITYDLAVELVIPLPGFVKRRAEMRILNTLKELKTRIES